MKPQAVTFSEDVRLEWHPSCLVRQRAYYDVPAQLPPCRVPGMSSRVECQFEQQEGRTDRGCEGALKDWDVMHMIGAVSVILSCPVL